MTQILIQKSMDLSNPSSYSKRETERYNSVSLGAVEEISLREIILKLKKLWKYLLSKWIVILIAGVFGGGLGLAYAYSQKPIYKAELTFALEEDGSGGGLGGALGLASQFGFDFGGSGGGAFSGDNLLQFMKSRSMVEKTLLTPVDIQGKTQTLAEFYIDLNKLRTGWDKKLELKNVHFLPGENRSTFTRQQDSLLGEFYNKLLKENLSVNKVDKKLSIISVKVNSINELFSKHFTEVLVEEVSDFYVETKIKRSVQNLYILQRQTDSVRRALNSAITGVASAVDANPNANPARQVLRAPSQRRQVDVQANQAILIELVKNLEISKVSVRKETPLIQIIDKPILPLANEKASKIKAVLLGSFLLGILTCLYLLIRLTFTT